MTGDARQGGFSLNTRETMLAGGDSGTAGFVAGKAAESEIIARITSSDPDVRMPSEGPPLPPEAVAMLRTWIDEKAPWEDGFAFKGTGYEAPLRLQAVVLLSAMGVSPKTVYEIEGRPFYATEDGKGKSVEAVFA